VAERPDGRAEDAGGGPPPEVDFAKLNGWDRDWETFSDYDLPTYVGPTTFMNLPWIEDPAELRARNVDVAIVGAPFDDAVSHRPGARFGPRASRNRLLRWPRRAPLDAGGEPAAPRARPCRASVSRGSGGRVSGGAGGRAPG